MNRHLLAPAATRATLKDPEWRKRVGFDSIQTSLPQPRRARPVQSSDAAISREIDRAVGLN